MAEQQVSTSSKALGVCGVTGSSGWFASSLVSQLTQNGHKVHCLDIQEPTAIDATINPYCSINEKLVTFHKCDITNLQQVTKALQEVDTLFHICAITDIRVCPIDAIHKVNVDGTKVLIEACKQCKVKTLVYTSSIEVVNDGKPKDQATEDIAYVDDYNPYGTTKTLAEKLILNARDDKLAVAALRLAHIYGPGDPIIYALTKYPVNIGDGTCKHSFIYIENCAYAHIQMAKALTTKSSREQCNGQAFNVKDHDHNFTKWYRDVLCEKTDQKCIYIPYLVAIILAYIYDFVCWLLFKLFGLRVGDPIETFGVLAVEAAAQEHTYNVDKFAKLVGYEPSIDVKESIRRTRDWRKRRYPKR